MFLREIRRVLTPGGRVVVANGTGPVSIAQAYGENAPRLDALRRKYPDRFPPNYDAYVQDFLRIAGTASDRFLGEKEILDMIGAGGFEVESVGHSPREAAGGWVAWRQFELYLAEAKVVPNSAFLWRFLHLSFLSLFDRRDYQGGLIVAATSRV
jgi:ubiquinone/menaquinone biosynthesis C-methylase UbiE